MKASEVPQTLSAEAQDVQRARNLLWFAEANYIDLPSDFVAQLRQASRLAAGEKLPPPVVQTQVQPQLTAAAADLISKFEGFYANPVGTGQFQTIGYGHVLTPAELAAGEIKTQQGAIKFKDGISKEQARLILETDLQPSYRLIAETIKVPITAEQRDALASFIFNVGPGTFRRSKLASLLNEGRYEAVPNELAKWTVRGGVEIPGLRRRREAEIELWKRPPVETATKASSVESSTSVK